MTQYAQMVYDLETFPNCFLAGFMLKDRSWMVYEISPRVNQSRELVEFLRNLEMNGTRLIGFNNIGFDYPIIHMLMQMGVAGAEALYKKAMAIIGAQTNQERWAHQVFPNNRYITQIDLYKIHHFDNRARSTSLKVLEFNMRMPNIQELPFPVGTMLNNEQIEVLRNYLFNDLDATNNFLAETEPMIEFRDELSARYNRDFTNHNDTKIGKDYFSMRLEEAGVPLYEYGSDGRQPRQTRRPQIHLRDAIFPWITFTDPEFTRILDWLKNQTIVETKGVFKDLVATVNGFDFVFGLGGIHGSIESEVMESTDDLVIVDVDVASYYPNLGITNRLYPAHLGSVFCDIYEDVFKQRKQYPKGSVENAMLKLALNGVYGDSNNAYSVFYDPLYTMSITLNGQLLLCLLAEQLMRVTGLQMIQVNTDGMTVRLPRTELENMRGICSWWETMTGLVLEEAIYKRMFIRDVNNYLAEYEDGGIKRKGAYEYDREWHQNHSAIVVAKVANEILLNGGNIRAEVTTHPDTMDFLCRAKVPRSSRLVHVVDGVDHPVQNLTRYYVSEGGGELVKLMPPTPKQREAGKTDDRRMAIEKGWTVCVCNDILDAKLPINYEYYITEVEKLCLILK